MQTITATDVAIPDDVNRIGGRHFVDTCYRRFRAAGVIREVPFDPARDPE